MRPELRLTLANDLREASRANLAARSFLVAGGLAEAAVYRACVAVEEILSNVIRHGYEDGDRHEIVFTVRIDEGSVHLRVVDNGRAFDPRSAPTVDVHAPLSEREVGGLGIHLLRTFASDITYERVDGKNDLRVRLPA